MLTEDQRAWLAIVDISGRCPMTPLTESDVLAFFMAIVRQLRIHAEAIQEATDEHWLEVLGLAGADVGDAEGAARRAREHIAAAMMGAA